MQVLAEAGAYVGQAAQPFDLLRLQLAFAIDDPDIDLQAVLIGQQFLHPVVELEEGADQNQAIRRTLN